MNINFDDPQYQFYVEDESYKGKRIEHRFKDERELDCCLWHHCEEPYFNWKQHDYRVAEAQINKNNDTLSSIDFLIRHIDPKTRYKLDIGEYPGQFIIDHLRNFIVEYKKLANISNG